MVIQRCLRKRLSASLHGLPHAHTMIPIPSTCRRCTSTPFSLAREAWDEFGSSNAKFSHQTLTQMQKFAHDKDVITVDNTSANAELCGLSNNVENMLRTLKSLCKQEILKETLLVLSLLRERGFQANNHVYVCVLQLCMTQKAFAEGKQVHDYIVRHLTNPNNVLANTLLNFYAKSGCVLEARRLFDRMKDRDIFSWTIVIEAFAKHEHSEVAFKLFAEMEVNGIEPDEICLLSVLKACGNLGAVEEGKIVHAYVIMRGLNLNVLVGSSLIEMYTKCAILDDAFQVFLCMGCRDVVVWNLMIAAYTEFNQLNKAFQFWELMKQEGVMCNGFTFFSILKACAKLGQIKNVHISGIISDNGLSPCFYNSLMNMYFKFEAPLEASQVFERMPMRDVVSWNSMLSGYVQEGSGQEALKVLEKMVQDGPKPDYLTFACALKACTSVSALEEGKEIHSFLYATGMEKNKFLTSTLIDMYGKCGDLEDAQKVFNNTLERDKVIWNSMIAVLIAHECCEEALQLFGKMGSTGVQGDDATFVNILKATAFLSLAKQGIEVHAYIVESGIRLTILQNALIDMYLKCGMMYDARTIFNRLEKLDVVSWNVMVSGYAQLNCSEEALDLFEKMQQEEVQPDKVTFLGVIKACANLAVYDRARKIQAYIDKTGFAADVSIRNAMVHMYGKCGRMDVACEIFEEAPERDIVSWNTVIKGYVQHGNIEEVFMAFFKLLQEGLDPNDVTFITVFKACADAAAIEYGKQVHTIVRETQYDFNSFVKSTLFDMYAKCGNIEAVRKLFEGAVEQDRVACNALIAGYAQHGLIEEALQVFSRLKSKCVRWELDHVSYLAIVSACSHMGLVAEGYTYFVSMQTDHDIIPSVELYVCLIDLQGRSGHLDEALLVANNMSAQPNVDVWIATLTACKSLNYSDLAKHVADYVLELDSENTAAVLLLANIFVARIVECEC